MIKNRIWNKNTVNYRPVGTWLLRATSGPDGVPEKQLHGQASANVVTH